MHYFNLKFYLKLYNKSIFNRIRLVRYKFYLKTMGSPKVLKRALECQFIFLYCYSTTLFIFMMSFKLLFLMNIFIGSKIVHSYKIVHVLICEIISWNFNQIVRIINYSELGLRKSIFIPKWKFHKFI